MLTMGKFTHQPAPCLRREGIMSDLRWSRRILKTVAQDFIFIKDA